MEVIKTERGWAGHFICADSCRFRRNTLIEFGNKRWVVSTVGNMVLSGKTETIGLERYYETMAFEAKKQGFYWDANISKPIYFDSEWAISNMTDWVDNDANEMHEAVVKELCGKIQQSD